MPTELVLTESPADLAAADALFFVGRRKRYDDDIQDYNTYIGLFPNNIIARIAGYKRNDAYFDASPAAQAVPQVTFPGPQN